jgi:hypothetical protein
MVLALLAACGPKGGGVATSEVANQPERATAGALKLPDGDAAIDAAYVWVSYDDVEGWPWMYTVLLGGGGAARSCDEVVAAPDRAALAPFVLYASEAEISDEDPLTIAAWGGYAQVYGRSVSTGGVDIKVVERDGETWIVDLQMTDAAVTGRISATWCGERTMPEAPGEEG